MSTSRRDFFAAAVAAVTGAAVVPDAAPAAPEATPAPVPTDPADRPASECLYYHHEDLGVHPAAAKAILALTLFDLTCDHAWGEYDDRKGLCCNCGSCLSTYADLGALERMAEVFRDVWMSNVRGRRADIVAMAPEIFREWMTDLAEDFEKGLRRIKKSGELSAEWDGPLAEVAAFEKPKVA